MIKKEILVALISAVTAIIVAIVGTYGTIYATENRLKENKSKVEALSEETNGLAERASAFASPVGTVVSSLLRPTEFGQIVGDPANFNPEVSKWAVADGLLNVGRSRYGKLTGHETLPDLRGVFLRGLNSFDSSRAPRSDQFADPDGKRELGSAQMDSFQGHRHELENGALVLRNKTEHKTVNGNGTWTYSELKVLDPIRDQKSGEPRTSLETRPKNVASYFYVRIN